MTPDYRIVKERIHGSYRYNLVAVTDDGYCKPISTTWNHYDDAKIEIAAITTAKLKPVLVMENNRIVDERKLEGV